MKKESNVELAFPDTLSKRNMERSLYRQIGSQRILTNSYTTALTIKQVARKVFFFFAFFNRAYSIITNKDDLAKENGSIKQVLKENEYDESVTSNTLKRITNNQSFSQSQQQTQATDIREEEFNISINLPYVEGASK